MNNTDKGKLLAVLFPEQVAGILQSLTDTFAFLTDNEQSLRSSWDNGLLPFDFWLAQAAEVADTIGRHKKTLGRNSSVFAQQLFGGYHALYTIDCITKQAAALPPVAGNTRYGLYVRVLFDHYTVLP
jgi:hypothetical protein